MLFKHTVNVVVDIDETQVPNVIAELKDMSPTARTRWLRECFVETADDRQMLDQLNEGNTWVTIRWGEL